jgi:hypothetical protein
MPNGICYLCQVEADLQNSHIIPAFVIRWLRESSGNGHIRLGVNPNQRIQDGVKRYWLCAQCEGRLNIFETTFATNLFYPYLEEPGRYFHYSSWLIHFCSSLSWRVLRFYLDEGQLKNWPAEALVHVNTAEQTWRELLLGKRPHPGAFQQHLLPLERLESATGELPPNINRYFMRAIDMDVCRKGKDYKAIYTYAKLGRFIILGFVHEPNPQDWHGTMVHVNKGIVSPKKYVLPRSFLEYLKGKAQRMADLLADVSPRQQGKIDTAFQQNIDRYVGSDEFEAMMADLSMFGDSAFSK